MEINRKQQYRPEQEQQERAHAPDSEMGETSQDIPIVRTNTPRPLSFVSMLSHDEEEQGSQLNEPFQLPRFPSMAPSAPPLPEELGEEDEERIGEGVSATVLTSTDKFAADNEGRDFVWLFEYGLEMDSAILNSAERLDGVALLYGAVVLRGYTLMVGTVEWRKKSGNSMQTFATIVSDTAPGAEVWGVIYRVPRRVAERNVDEPSILETIHFAGTEQALFREVQVTVNDPYRKREITCVTYVATESTYRQIAFVPIGQAMDTLFVQRLVELARKLRLPDRYLGMYPSQQAAQVSGEYITIAAKESSLDTDPLPAMKEKCKVSTLASNLPETPLAAVMPQSTVASELAPSRLLMVFAIYLIITLLGGLTFAVFQGLGFAQNVLNDSFVPLDVPWLVMFYGLLGGCISCIAMLVRYRVANPPHFVIISWFARPYIAAVLAALAYLILNSGIFALRLDGEHHQALFLLSGAIAGLCEGWLLFRYK